MKFCRTEQCHYRSPLGVQWQYRKCWYSVWTFISPMDGTPVTDFSCFGMMRIQIQIRSPLFSYILIVALHTNPPTSFPEHETIKLHRSIIYHTCFLCWLNAKFGVGDAVLLLFFERKKEF